MCIKRLRNFLEENKVFFEVVVSVLLSIMAVLVSIEANRIANAQTRIMEQENSPHLEIRMTQDYNQELKIYDNTNWLVFNRGGKIIDFEANECTFFKFYYGQNPDSIVIPIYGYFNLRGLLSGESEGLIYQVDNDHNGKIEIALRDSLMNYGYFEMASYIEITYRDIFDKKHSEYYQIAPGYNRINKEQWGTFCDSLNYGVNRTCINMLSASKIISQIRNSSH